MTAVQRAGARADDRRARPLRPAARRRSARTSSRAELDEAAFLRRLREDDPTRPIGDALIDQRTIAGIGNLWKIEGCFEAGVDPWRRAGDVSDEEALAIVRCTRPRMPQSARARHAVDRFQVVYGKAGEPCPRCGEASRDPVARPGRRQPDDILVPGMSALRRIGHKGADLIVPGNTPASFDAALGPRRRHDRVRRAARASRHARHRPAAARARLRTTWPDAPTLEQGLAHLASSPFHGVELDVDLKLPGYEQRVVAALRTHGLVERSLVSSNWMRSLVEIRALEPRLRLGWSVPRLKRDPTIAWLTKLPALAGAVYVRGRLPAIVRGHMAAGRCDALMAHWRLVSPRLVRAVREAGGELYVWTVDEAAQIGRLERLGVTGVITNDPRLFAHAAERSLELP